MRRLLAEIVTVIAIGIAGVVFFSTSGLVDRLRDETEEPDLPQFCHDRDLVAWDGSTVRGMAFLCLDGRSVELIAAPERLVAGRSYTAWMLYANDPRLCGDRGCEAPRQDDPQNQWVQARIGGVNADSQGTARISATYRSMRLSQGARVLVAVVEGGEPSAGAIYERAARVLLPGGPATRSLPVIAPDTGLPVDGGPGIVVAHALFTMLMPSDS